MTKKCLLFVEDYPVIQALYVDTLKQDGFEVDIAPDGEKALELTADHHYDVILLDILLPKMDGLDFLERYLKMPGNTVENTKIIVLSDFEDQKHKRRAYKLGVKHYWMKVDYTPHQLAEKIKQVLS